MLLPSVSFIDSAPYSLRSSESSHSSLCKYLCWWWWCSLIWLIIYLTNWFSQTNWPNDVARAREWRNVWLPSGSLPTGRWENGIDLLPRHSCQSVIYRANINCFPFKRIARRRCCGEMWIPWRISKIKQVFCCKNHQKTSKIVKQKAWKI